MYPFVIANTMLSPQHPINLPTVIRPSSFTISLSINDELCSE